MKKILISSALAIMLASSASADIVRVEMGVGAWMQTPSGTAEYNAGAGVQGTNKFDETEDTSPYVWMLIKHPIPIIPNIRLEYTSIHSTGESSGKWGSFAIPSTSKSTLDLKEYDIVPYYNILDNTFWLSVDIGVDIKIIDSDYKVDSIATFTGYNDTSTIAIPLGYLRARVQVPTTGLGVESDVKYITYNGSTVYDIRAKVDYTFDISPIIQPAIEVGYRTHKIKIDDSSYDVKSDITFSGFYTGIMLRF